MRHKNILVGLCCGFFAISPARALSDEYCGMEEGRYPITFTTVIDATSEEVWDVISDFKNYGRWNRCTVKIDGELKKDAVIKAYGDDGKTLDLQITAINRPRSLCWNDVTWFTHFGVGGWRCRTIKAIPYSTAVLFTNHFEFTGTFDWVLNAYARGFLERCMIQENESLRDFIEAKKSSTDEV